MAEEKAADATTAVRKVTQREAALQRDFKDVVSTSEASYKENIATLERQVSD